MLTKEQARKTQDAWWETKRLLARELSYSVKHQNAERIESYQAHIVKLEGMLAIAYGQI